MKRNIRKCFDVLMILFFAFIGIKGAIWIFTDTLLIIESRHWVSTQATIDEVRIERSSGRSGPQYSPLIRYHFTVNGNEYTGNRFEIPSRNSPNEVLEISRVSTYRLGGKTSILYDASDPNYNVVLRPEMSYFFTIGLGGLSLLFLAWSIWMAIVFVRGFNQR